MLYTGRCCVSVCLHDGQFAYFSSCVCLQNFCVCICVHVCGLLATLLIFQFGLRQKFGEKKRSKQGYPQSVTSPNDCQHFNKPVHVQLWCWRHWAWTFGAIVRKHTWIEELYLEYRCQTHPCSEPVCWPCKMHGWVANTPQRKLVVELLPFEKATRKPPC